MYHTFKVLANLCTLWVIQSLVRWAAVSCGQGSRINVHTFKKHDYYDPWVLTHNNGACKYPTETTYHIDIFISNGLYKITNESIKVILNIKQFRHWKWFDRPYTLMYRICPFSLHPLSRYSIHSTQIPLSIFQPIIHFKV